MRIAAFPKGQDIWRIDWFGPIAFPDRMTRRRHPSVLVYLSKVVASTPLENPKSLLQPDCTLPASQQTKRWVSVGTTLLLRIGDLWQDQTLLARPNYEEETFENLTIDREHTSLVKAGSSFENGQFLLPLAQHPWHLNNTHSYCIRVALPERRYLVVPCMELVRFYFGSSSELISRLFEPPLARSNLHGKVHLSPIGNMNLELAERIPQASAEDVARIAGSDAAWRAAALIPSSCLKASTAGHDVYPQAIFPFEGLTTLEVTGKWLPQGDVDHGTFLVYQLRSCSHPFPFRALRFKLSLSASQRPVKRGTLSPTPEVQSRRTSAKPKASTLREQDASSSLGSATKPVFGRRRFPDLDNKPVKATRPIQTSSSQTAYAGSAPAVADMAVGSPGSSQRIRSVSLVDAKQDNLPGFLKHVLPALAAIEVTQVRVLQSGDEEDWTIPTPMLVNEDGVLPNTLLISNESHRPRRVASFLIEKNGESAVLTAFEALHLMLLLCPLSPDETEKSTSIGLEIAKSFATRVQRPNTAVLFVPKSNAAPAEFIRRWIVAKWTALVR
ncbi:hypothetical protein HNP33_003990 [Comamonas odontotermitis]|uniref:Uncharacterized protein n=1 Tax=Comamonas odontotermitis TaxID=379895 RepID=A0ABR6RL63_9BURK|nr:hypothetical protein [Comamonas odontotermitis]